MVGEGGDGGGAIYILANNINFAGNISADGENGRCGGVWDGSQYVSDFDQSSGGGSGGSIRIEGETISFTGSVTADKGNGWSQVQRLYCQVLS